MAEFDPESHSYNNYIMGTGRTTKHSKEPIINIKKSGAISSFSKSCFEWMQAIISAIIIVVLVLTFVFRMVEVSGDSMENTLLNEDKVVVTNLFYTPEPGDIVVISHGEYYNKPIIKRVIAVAGQTLSIDFDTGEVVVDGVTLNETYIKNPTTKRGNAEIPEVIPEGKVFVMGDNRDVSQDSRYTSIGLIPVENIIGKAQCIVFPFDRLGKLYD